MKNMIKDYTSPFIIFSFLVVFTIFVIKLLLPSIKSLIPFLNGSLSNITQAVVLFWTGVALVIYTYETKKLREEIQKQVETAHNQIKVGQDQVEETKRQTEIQQRPFVIFEVLTSDVNVNRLIPTLKNIGNGIALNVRMNGEIIVLDRPIVDGETWGEYVDAYSCTYSSGEHIIKSDGCISIEDGKWSISSLNKRDFPIKAIRFHMLHTQDSQRLYKTRIEFQNIDMDRVSKNGH